MNLLRYLGLEGKARNHFHYAMCEVIISILCNVKDEELFIILAKKFVSFLTTQNVVINSFMNVEGSHQYLTADDHTNLQERGKACQVAMRELEEYSLEYQEQRRELRDRRMAETLESMPKKKAKVVAKAAAADPPPLAVPNGDLTQPELKKLIPPGASIWVGRASRTVNGHYKPFKRDSASSHLYGNRWAAILVLRQLWRKHLLVEGRVESECPIRGLF